MTEPPEPSPTSAPSTRESAAAMAEMAPQVQVALIAIGLLGAAALWPIDVRSRSDARSALAATAALGGSVLAGWVSRRLLCAAASLLDLCADGVEAAARLDKARERAPTHSSEPAAPEAPTRPDAPSPSTTMATATATDHSRTTALAEVRLAIRQGQWALAEELIRRFDDSNPEDPASGRLAGEMAAAKESAVAGLRARIEAARAAHDPQQILEIREALVPAITPEALRTMDRDLAHWFMDLIQKRLRSGVLTIDVALLAARVAEAFETTPEGASLRAALPTLRRSVGLCARCGRPYNGIADACPTCLATASFPVYIPPEAPSPAPPSNGGPARGMGSNSSDAIATEPE